MIALRPLKHARAPATGLIEASAPPAAEFDADGRALLEPIYDNCALPLPLDRVHALQRQITAELLDAPAGWDDAAAVVAALAAIPVGPSIEDPKHFSQAMIAELADSCFPVGILRAAVR